MNRKTKVIATLGPASSSEKNIARLIKLGVNIFRLNFSHGTHEQHAQLIKRIRMLAQKVHHPVGILADLPGPKLRLGLFENSETLFLKANSDWILTTEKILGKEGILPVDFPKLPSLLNKNDKILLADGKLQLIVSKVFGHTIHCKVTVGGELKERQGINIPGKKLDIPAFTFRDKKAIKMLKDVQVDFIALSFIQTEQDIITVRKEMKKLAINIPIIAKIEKPEALRRIDNIIELVDGIMIARGDLGVEIETEKVPVIQKQLIRLANKAFKPVITATQMLESMTHNSRPTRAETTDVANAIWDGTDAVMLSGETASGKYPMETVKTMIKIIKYAESHRDFSWHPDFHDPKNPQHSVLNAAAKIADPKLHKGIVTYTESGNTAMMLSKMHPEVPIYALTPHAKTCQKMSLIRNVQAYISPAAESMDQLIAYGDQTLIKEKVFKKKDTVVVTAGSRLSVGATNMMKIHNVGDFV